MSSYALYIHLPFCLRKCGYCDFVSYAGQESLIPSYLKGLEQEIRYYSASLSHPAINTLYLGGGTPTVLEGKQIEGILESIRSHFKLSPQAEITIEANPGTVGLEKLNILKATGINRLSLGAQSFNDRHLKKLGRVHTVSQIYESFETARRAGFKNINLDLIFALPDQNLPDWQKTLKQAVSLGPEHISTYNLTIEEDTPFFLERESLNLPDEDLELKMYEEAINYLTSNGWQHYEISNFAQPGKRCQHNINYWRNQEYIGLGAGAHSHLNGQRYANSNSIEEYLGKDKGYIREEKASPMTETIFLGLRLLEGIDSAGFKQRFGVDIKEAWAKELNELINLELVISDNSHLKLTRKGLYLADEVLAKFL